jgi:hypothetical protein
VAHSDGHDRVARVARVTARVDEALSGQELALEVDRWLAELGIEPLERASRDGVESWDLVLDGARRRDIRITLILDPRVALVCWVHYAPPLNDSFRASYRKLLRWNDELPLVKFAISPDERPVLTSELGTGHLDRDALGLTLARLVAVCDLLVEASVDWLWPHTKKVPVPDGEPRNAELLARYAGELGELGAGAPSVG